MDGITPRSISKLTSNAMHIGAAQAQGREDKMEVTKEPTDKVTLQNILKYKKEDLTPSGTLGVIIEAKNPEKLAQIKEKVAEDPKSKFKVDLPIISGFAAEIDPNSQVIIPDLTQSVGDVRIFLDDKVSLIKPVEQSDNDISAMMDVAGKAMGIDKVWDKGYKGKGTTICVVDTGIAQHTDLKSRIIDFKDFVNKKDGKENAYDDHGHGTHCSGIAAGDGSASGGKYAGAAPEARLVGVKVLDKNGSGTFSNVIAGIQWAVENKERLNIDIISISLGGYVNQSYKDDPVAQAVEAAVGKGIITVVAAGNEGPKEKTIGTPAHAPHVITVGALDDKRTVDKADDDIAYFSSRGPTKYDNLPKPDVLAPGVRITAPKHTGGYTSMSGTSMACPMVAGMAALIKQVIPTVSPGELKGVVMGTADNLKNLTHKDQGGGVFDVAEAIEKLTGQQINPPPPPPPQQNPSNPK